MREFSSSQSSQRGSDESIPPHMGIDSRLLLSSVLHERHRFAKQSPVFAAPSAGTPVRAQHCGGSEQSTLILINPQSACGAFAASWLRI
jgi:hypothetical protein